MVANPEPSLWRYTQGYATSVFILNASYIFKPDDGGTMGLAAQDEGPEDLKERMAYGVGSERCIPTV